jgi:predicted LPLAT superfamily acyltransferase
MPTCFSPAAAELACCLSLRSPAFHAKAFATSLVAATLFVVLLPLLVTGTSARRAGLQNLQRVPNHVPRRENEGDRARD